MGHVSGCNYKMTYSWDHVLAATIRVLRLYLTNYLLSILSGDKPLKEINH